MQHISILRKEGDSNPRIGFADYTLSRRASSATRAPFLVSVCKIIVFQPKMGSVVISFNIL